MPYLLLINLALSLLSAWAWVRFWRTVPEVEGE